MRELNQFQIKSLAKLFFDLSKAWFVAGVITPIGISSMAILNRMLLLVVGILGSWFFLQFGLSFGEEIKE